MPILLLVDRAQAEDIQKDLQIVLKRKECTVQLALDRDNHAYYQATTCVHTMGL